MTGLHTFPDVGPFTHPDALCTDYPDVDFFPSSVHGVRVAQAVCARCLARAACLAFAVEHDERHGVWGGLSERQRRPLVAARRRLAAIEPGVG